MAALSSTQSGNWTSSSTWGGATPADGDTFTINHGHKITVNSDNRPTNGYGDIVVQGNLHLATNGKMRINGRITVKGYNTAANNVSGGAWFTEGSNGGGLLSSAGNNILLEFEGTNNDQHGIWVENELWASLKLEADEKKTTTTTSQATNTNNDSIDVASSSGFGIGDWIAVYKEQEDDRVMGDEGFWVHDVDSSANRLYIRQFVSPTAVIQKVSGQTIFVDDAKVFRVGYKLICGTGSNRVVATITNINYSLDKITTSASFSSSNVGQTLYQTGSEKLHISGKKVQKVATTLTTAVTSENSTNQITVGSNSDILVGDSIIIDVNNDNDFGWDYDTQYTVTAKSGTTLTLNSQVRNIHKAGSVVQVLDRHFVIKGVDTDVRAFLYVEYWTDYNNASTRHITLKNIRFTQFCGNTASTYYSGVMIAGYNSRYHEDDTSNLHQHQTTIQGVVVDNSNVRGNYNGLSTRHPHSLTLRNCTVYYTGNQGIWNWSSTHNLKQYNNYVTRTSYSSIQRDAMYEPYSEDSYNYLTRSDDYGYMLQNFREQCPIRHNYLLNHENRCSYTYYSNHEMVMERMYFDGFRYAPYQGTANGTLNFIDCYMDNRWLRSTETDVDGVLDSTRYLTNSNAESRADYDRDNGNLCTFASYEHNFKYDQKAIHNGGGTTIQNSDNPKVKKVYSHSSSKLLDKQQVYVPANTTVRISSAMKLSAVGSYTRPHLMAREVTKYSGAGGRWSGAYTGNTGFVSDGDSFNGFLDQIQFSAAAVGNWETKQLTLGPKKKGYFVLIGIRSEDNGHEEVHEMEDIEVFFDKAPAIDKSNNQGKSIAVRSGFARAKKRIGGTRL